MISKSTRIWMSANAGIRKHTTENVLLFALLFLWSFWQWTRVAVSILVAVILVYQLANLLSAVLGDRGKRVDIALSVLKKQVYVPTWRTTTEFLFVVVAAAFWLFPNDYKVVAVLVSSRELLAMMLTTQVNLIIESDPAEIEEIVTEIQRRNAQVVEDVANADGAQP